MSCAFSAALRTAVAAALLGLELAGRVMRHPGGFVSLSAA